MTEANFITKSFDLNEYLNTLISIYQNSDMGVYIFSPLKEIIKYNSKSNYFTNKFTFLYRGNFTLKNEFSNAFSTCISNHESVTLIDNDLQASFYFNPIVFDNSVQYIVVNVVDDITEKNDTKENSDNYRFVLDHIAAHVWLMNPLGLIYWSNKTTQDYYGINENEILQGKWVENIHPDDVKISNSGITDSVLHKRPNLTQLRIKGKDNVYRLFSSATVPILNDQNELLYRIGVNFEIDSYKKEIDAIDEIHDYYKSQIALKDKEIKKLNKDFFNQQKFETIGQLAGGIAHDFNNILSVISLNIDLIKSQDEHLNFKDEISPIINSVINGSRLASQLMVFSGKNPNLPTIINVSELVDSIKLLLKKSLTDKIILNINVCDDPYKVFVDQTYLENAILNIVLNSRDALQNINNAKIDFFITNFIHDGSDKDLNIDNGEYLLISINDNGAGIPANDLDRIFDPFFTTKDLGKGTGLGLPMVYSFVKKAEGNIRVTSEVNVGTSLEIYLPKAKFILSEDKSKELFINNFDFNYKKILVVDDNPEIRDATIKNLHKYGFICYSSYDAASALQFLKNGLKVDIVFSDVMMPGPLSAVGFYNELSKFNPDIPILFTSGYAENILVKDGNVLKGYNLLLKPYTIDKLLYCLKELLEV